MICNNFTGEWYRVILSQYLNNFYTEFLPITDEIGVKFRERGKILFLNMWPLMVPGVFGNSIYLLDITRKCNYYYIPDLTLNILDISEL